ncbi:MAG: hypothetical protein QNJ97_12340 [Myxococcota bacterium]|nr:hypothetical protein [Myxococcota bacterium]
MYVFNTCIGTLAVRYFNIVSALGGVLAVLLVSSQPQLQQPAPKQPQCRNSGESVQKTATPDQRCPPDQRGIALGLYSEDPDWSYVPMLEEMAAVGANHAAIVVPWYMKTSIDVSIFAHPEFTVPERTIKKAIADARSQGLSILFFPILRVEDKSNGGWRGTLAPADVDAFFANYEAFILRLAAFAETLCVPLFSIGSELSSMDVHEEKWRGIIAKVREVYSGDLLYSANWDHFEKVAFFDALDYVGVTGYFELTQPGTDPTVSDLVRSWQGIKTRLLDFQSRIKKPLILTEVGYLSQKNTAAWPWKEGADDPIDLEGQRRCYEAFRLVWGGEPSLAGVYFWNWFGWGGRKSKEYTPRGKPAAEEIATWYFER